MQFGGATYAPTTSKRGLLARSICRVRPVTVAGLGACVLLGLIGSPVVAETSTNGAFCGTPVAAEQSQPKQINLVVDDSGSMFYGPGGQPPLDRWSKAKYALEVFAALMDPNDSLNVYRLSDFDKASDSEKPVVKLGGETGTSAKTRVGQILEMNLAGQKTPFLAVQRATEDLLQSKDPDKWLVVVTDGAFQLPGQTEDLAADSLNERTRGFVTKAKKDGTPFNVAYLAIGEDVPTLTEDRALGIYSWQAQSADQLLLKMNDLAQRVFGRSQFDLPTSGAWRPGEDAVDLDQAIVFAQGEGASISKEAETANGIVEASEVVDVEWSENRSPVLKGVSLPALPDKSLQGQVAFFSDIPRGDVTFGLTNVASTVPVKVFYKPSVTLGYQLLDPESGDVVTQSEPVSGTYDVKVGFMNKTDGECQFVDSLLLGEKTIDSVKITQDGKLIGDEFSLDSVDFPKGGVDIEIAGTYLDGVPISTPEPFVRAFLPKAFPSKMKAKPVSYTVSEMAEFPLAGKQIPLEYTVVENGVPRAPTPEEWASLEPSAFTVESAANLDFEVQKGDALGRLNLLVRAPGGDVYDATTGSIEATVSGSYVPGATESVAKATVPIEVVNDISAWERMQDWFKTVGWKLLLLLLALLLLMGYLFKRRFPKNVKGKPAVDGVATMVGTTAINGQGKFVVNPVRRWLPFVANTATLAYVPSGTYGFTPMKLKAGKGKSMIVTNWQQLAQKDNVEINGMPLNSETRRAPKFGAAATITATTPQMTFESNPNRSA